MTLHAFNQLPFPRQKATVYVQGRLLASRRVGEEVVNLYYLSGGLFAELYYDTLAHYITQVQAFTHAAQLEDYARLVQLPEWMPEMK